MEATRHRQTVLCRFRSPSGEFEVPRELLEPLWDPFDLLRAPPAPSVYPDPIYPYEGWLRRERLILLNAYRNDPISPLSNSRVEPQLHQVSVALRALEKPRPRLILADEVGLGKTIEAGLILKELRARMRSALERVLVIVPASLVSQWQYELQSKFNETFVFHDSGKLRQLAADYAGQNPWCIEPNVICSLQFARSDAQREQIARADWDLVIVDEAHHARRHWDDGEPRPNDGYRLLDDLRDRVGGMLLLTATPMQLHDYELYSTIELVEPGLFRSYREFGESRHEIATINRATAILKSSDPPPEELSEAASILRQFAAPNGDGLVTRESRLAAAAFLERRHRLSQALVRNRKSELKGFTRRIARRIPVKPTVEELDVERDVRAYLRRSHLSATATGNTGLGLVLVSFQKMLCSSSRALAAALETRARRLLNEAIEEEGLSDDPEVAEDAHRAIDAVSPDTAAEIEELRDLARRARRIQDAKLDALERAVTEFLEGQPDEKVLIFTQYIATLEMVRERLAQRFSVRAFHGGMTRDEKDAAHRAFKGRVQILVASEAGGEGRNFQFCHVVINYDLPWNPMRVEQRIGRVDRVGQKKDVSICNFAVAGTLDEHVLNVLEHRIRVFTETVGALDPILGDVEDGIARIAIAEIDGTKEAFHDLDAELAERIREARELDRLRRDFVLGERSLRQDEMNRLLRREPLAGKRELERFCRAALSRVPSHASEVRDEADDSLFVKVPGILRRANKALWEDYRGTFDVAAALENETLHFFAFGHPLVEGLIDMCGDPWWTPVSVLESPDVLDDRFRLQVDYRLELYGIHDSGCLISHLVDGEGVHSPIDLSLPPGNDHFAPFRAFDAELVDDFRRRSYEAAQREAFRRFEEFADHHAELAIEERQRLDNMYTSRLRHIQDRIDRNERLVERWEQSGTEAERRAIQLRRGQIEADQRRLAEVEQERSDALAALDAKKPERYLRLLGATIVVPPGRLEELAEA